ncbi:helix-turn-helix domain-containing protein [Bacillus sp. X1(2014)]|uniref:helix-turn-helix domain-containing protein n=1 Tax=Bacillus sp. X1(2014) TaxID=1565991 RepID=UPI0011A90715|nr:transcriptional regulator [Bacillus sp. X1(2014)]
MTTVESSKITMRRENVPDQYRKVPNSIHDYIELGLISGNDLIVYLRLYKLFNDSIGYAFPTIDQLEVYTNLSRGTLTEAIKKLVAVGLIKKGQGYKGNNVYVVYKPLEQAELYKQVPDMVERLQSKKIKKNIQAERDKQRLQQFKESIEEQEQEFKAVRIEPRVESYKVDSTAKKYTDEEIVELTKDMSFEEYRQFMREQNLM